MSAVIETNEAAVPPEQKYLVEAAKRKRAEGLNQFEELHFSDNERLRSLADDPWADHAALDTLPAPIDDGGRVKFLISGAGMGGISMAIRLIKEGFTAEQIVLVDAAGDIGGRQHGTGIVIQASINIGRTDLTSQGDIEAYCYLPFLEDTGYMPKQKYSSSVEIRAYIQVLVKHFGLQGRVLFRSQIKKLEWDESHNTWNTKIILRRGSEGKDEKTMSVHADFVTLASGVFPYPQVPRVSGLADFAGKMFHTSRWNYNVTGGTCDSVFPEMVKLTDVRVGIIGTGATAVQVVPQLAKYAKELYVFQRTPSQVNPRGQRDTDSTEWNAKIAANPGWQKHRIENLAECISSHIDPGSDDLVDDNWSRLKTYAALVGGNRFGRISPEKAQEHIGNMVALDADHNKEVREQVSEVVKDKQTAEQLTPWYPTWCKRPTFSDVYLQAFNNENVHLIDTDGKGIDCVTPQGIVANGQDYPLDILVLSTGYRSPATHGDPGSKAGIEIVGRNGRKLSEKYEQEGICTLHGVCTNGYPNLFHQSAAQAGATANYMHTLDVLSEHIASIIAQGLKRSPTGSAIIEASYDAETAWGMRIAQKAAYFSSLVICTPGYNNAEGEAFDMPPVDDHVAMLKKAKAAIWQPGIVDFVRFLEKWRGNGNLEGLEVSIKA